MTFGGMGKATRADARVRTLVDLAGKTLVLDQASVLFAATYGCAEELFDDDARLAVERRTWALVGSCQPTRRCSAVRTSFRELSDEASPTMPLGLFTAPVGRGVCAPTAQPTFRKAHQRLLA